jgi:hypothetical protein
MNREFVMQGFNRVSNGTSTTPQIAGRSLAHLKRNAVERAFLGADLVDGLVCLVRPTIPQVSWLVGVNRTYIAAALGVGDNPDTRVAILEGYVPLIVPPAPPVPPAKPVRFGDSVRWGESLAEHIARSTPAERAEAALEVGPGTIWDSMIVPSIS